MTGRSTLTLPFRGLDFGGHFTNELMASCSLECWRPDSTGKEKLYYRIDLTNAIIAGIATNFPNEQEGNIMAEDSLY